LKFLPVAKFFNILVLKIAFNYGLISVKILFMKILILIILTGLIFVFFWSPNPINQDQHDIPISIAQESMNTQLDDSLLFSKAQVLANNKDYLKATVIYEELLKRDPNNWTVMEFLADCLTEMKEYSKAIEIYEKIYSHQPHQITHKSIVMKLNSLYEISNQSHKIKNIHQ
jgi:tetratricopeptide (TPR) repeat protein